MPKAKLTWVVTIIWHTKSVAVLNSITGLTHPARTSKNINKRRLFSIECYRLVTIRAIPFGFKLFIALKCTTLVGLDNVVHGVLTGPWVMTDLNIKICRDANLVVNN